MNLMRFFRSAPSPHTTQPEETPLALFDEVNLLHYGNGRSGMANFDRRLFHHHKNRGVSMKVFAESAIFLPIHSNAPEVENILGRATVAGELIKLTNEITLREKNREREFPTLVVFFINQMLILDGKDLEGILILQAIKDISIRGPKVGITIVFDLGFRADEALVNELKGGFPAKVFLGRGYSSIFSALFEEPTEDISSGKRYEAVFKLGDETLRSIFFYEVPSDLDNS